MKGDAITIQHPMHDTFLLTETAMFQEALARADSDETDSNEARKIGWKSTIVTAVNNAPLLEDVTLGGDVIVRVPMTDTTFMLPPGTIVKNASFNADGKFTDDYSLVVRYVVVSDLASLHRKEQHRAVWIALTMAVNTSKKGLEIDQNATPKTKGPAFTLRKRD